MQNSFNLQSYINFSNYTQTGELELKKLFFKINLVFLQHKNLRFLMMKKIVFILCLSCFCLCQSAFCQKDTLSKPHSNLRNEIGINAGPLSFAGLIKYGGTGILNAIFTLGTMPMGLNVYGNYSIHYYYQVKPWCQVGIKTGIECAKANFYSDTSRTRVSYVDRYTRIVVMPSVRFTYLNRPWVRIYSGLDLGCAVLLTNTTDYSETKAGVEYLSGDLRFAFNVTAFGVNVGKKFYGMFELNAGYDSIVKFGIGARF